MYAYIARQPVFDLKQEIVGYELLYRNGGAGREANVRDEDAATRRVLSDAVTVFGLSRLTQGKPAHMIFTRNLLLEDFARLVSPKELVVEVQESIQMDEALADKLRELKKDGYTLALANYTGETRLDKLLPLFQIIKVDFRATPAVMQKLLARTLSGGRALLLAEKVETKEEYDRAVELGFRLFQGYFLERPTRVSKQVPSLAASSYGRLMNELLHENVDMDACQEIISTDVVLTYLLLRQIQTARYYRGNRVTELRQAMVMMGTEELRRWLCLVMARQSSAAHSDELARKTYLWGRFIEKLMENARGAPDRREGFLLGMFSMLDRVMGTSMEDLLRDLDMRPELKAALLGREENEYSKFLQYVMVYEMHDERLLFPDIQLKLDQEKVDELYQRCVEETRQAFSRSKEQRA